MQRKIYLPEYIDHTNLSPIATNADIRKLCDEAIRYNFKSVCVNPSKINICKEALKNTNVLICTVVGFPLGQNTKISKVSETIDAVNNGADEIDMVINISELKARNKIYCIEEINDVVKAAKGRVVKVIVETALLDENDKIFAYEVVNASNAHFIKTSTGFSTSGAKIEDIELWAELRRKDGSNLEIKAAGGISTYNDLLLFIISGADRIGTSRAVKLFNGNDLNVTVDIITSLSINGKTLQQFKNELKKTNKLENQEKNNENKNDKKPELKQKENNQKDNKETKQENKEDKKDNKTDDDKNKNELKVQPKDNKKNKAQVKVPDKKLKADKKNEDSGY